MKWRVSSDTSIASDVASFQTKLSLSKRCDNLALEALSMLPPEVQRATTTFHRYWMNDGRSSLSPTISRIFLLR